ncbi:MAG: alpha-N-acetylglucosaminidase [Bacteroidales bacterium]|jgi:alpha-N-acetylglucosaminidase|nr:alpha-N-acetylglucosaminidase [Bacteroidales bacterium]
MKSIKHSIYLISLLLIGNISVQAADVVKTAEGLLSRRVPALAGKIRFEVIPAENGQDVFELQTRGGKTVIRGNNGVAMASGLNWYLKHYCHCQITHRSEQLNLPLQLPKIKETVRIVTPHKYRYYLNYCCFSYTLAWWDWNDWERMIDLMAMYGVNVPLSVTGQEGVWLNVGKRYGLTEEQMQDFFVGPAYLPFGWMGCIDRWAGPLRKTWIDEHVELEKKILDRERAFGMTPILQGFTGHVPRKLTEVRSDVKLVELTPWAEFEPTFFVDPNDPFFIEFGKIFVEEQTKLFGTDHLYASDTFIEMPPPSDEPAFLQNMGASIYKAMQSADADATWVLQCWMFFHGAKFWKAPQQEALLRSVPQDKLLAIDLMCEQNPVWHQSNAFYGQPWIWSIIQNFGGTVSLHGAIDFMANDLKQAMQSRGKESGKLSGIGYIMEGLGWNPLIDEFQSDLVWRSEVPNTSEWIEQFVLRRYGQENADAQEAWKILHETAYKRAGRTDNATVKRPSLAVSPPNIERQILPALKTLLNAEQPFGKTQTYLFDVANISREVFGSLANAYHQQMISAYHHKDREALKAAAGKMNTLILDLDRLLACHPQFLLGTELESAKRWGKTPEEQQHYEWNARTMYTLWGPTFRLDDYSNRQWSGMFRSYYAKRWNLFYRELDKSLTENTIWDAKAFDRKLLSFQTAWGKDIETFPTKPSGESVTAIAKALLAKYEREFEDMPEK